MGNWQIYGVLIPVTITVVAAISSSITYLATRKRDTPIKDRFGIDLTNRIVYVTNDGSIHGEAWVTDREHHRNLPPGKFFSSEKLQKEIQIRGISKLGELTE